MHIQTPQACLPCSIGGCSLTLHPVMYSAAQQVRYIIGIFHFLLKHQVLVLARDKRTDLTAPRPDVAEQILCYYELATPFYSF